MSMRVQELPEQQDDGRLVERQMALPLDPQELQFVEFLRDEQIRDGFIAYLSLCPDDQRSFTTQMRDHRRGSNYRLM